MKPEPARGLWLSAGSGATFVGLSAILIWSSLSVLTVLSGTMPAFELAACTFAIGGTAGLVAAGVRGRLGALRQPWPVWAVGVGGLFGYHALYFAALRRRQKLVSSIISGRS